MESQATCRAWTNNWGAGVAILLATTLLATQPALAQDSSTEENAVQKEPNESADSGNAKTAFDAAFEAYKGELTAIEALRSEYQSADAGRREQINNELTERHPKSLAALEEMVNAAIAAYQAAPETDPQITNLLVTVAAHRTAGSDESGQGGDDFEAALKVINTLVDGGNETPELALWGIIAAFCTNDFERAEQYEQLARKNGALSNAPDGKNKIAAEIYSIAVGMAGGIAQQKQLWEAEKKIRDAEAAADDLPRVQMETTEGTVVIELFENEAPQAVANFITLVKDNFYDGVVFHRVLPRFMAQGGDPTGTGSGGPGHNIRCECYGPEARLHFRGSLSMAHAGRDTGGSQFFLTFLPTAHLNGRHTVFGRVIEGFDVLAKLVRVDPSEGSDVLSKIVKAEVLRDRGHDYSTRFERLPGR